MRFCDLPVKTVFFFDGGWLWKNTDFFATEFDFTELVILDEVKIFEETPCVSLGFADTEQDVKSFILSFFKSPRWMFFIFIQ